jgi:hypothetical protein
MPGGKDYLVAIRHEPDRHDVRAPILAYRGQLSGPVAFTYKSPVFFPSHL